MLPKLGVMQEQSFPNAAESTAFRVLLALGLSHLLNDTLQSVITAVYPLLIGWVLNTYCKGPVVDGAQTYDYTLPMAIFALFGVLALIVALMLKAENKKKGYGLEEANIQK